MNILLNFLPLKSGGGVQVGLDFIVHAKMSNAGHRWFLVATEGTPIASVAETDNVKLVKVIANNCASRLWFEYFGCKQVVSEIRADVIYTQFGPQWPGSSHLPNIVGCAYSNLFYPEIDFWGNLSVSRKLFRQIVDSLRRWRLMRADAVIFETDNLAERAVKLLGINPKKVHVVKPCASTLVNPGGVHPATRERCNTIPPGYRVLLLSVYNPNKNIELLPEIAVELRRAHDDSETVFVITLPSHAKTTRAIMEKAEKLGVASQLYNIGPIPHEGCCELYKACNAVILPSQLESFSNNIAEAWTMRKPILITDMDWARSLCGNGAVYFKYRDSYDAAQKLLRIKNDRTCYDTLVEAGEDRLRSYPTPSERFHQYLATIERFGLQ